MERERCLVLLDCLMAIQRNQMQMHILLAKIQAIRDRRKERTCWVRQWITLRPDQGAYGNLMHLLRNVDVEGFRNFTLPCLSTWSPASLLAYRSMIPGIGRPFQ